MFEDLARNLEVPHALGMTTVLVVPQGQREVFREGWELEGRDAPHVDHVTDDLAGYLRDIVSAGGAGMSCCTSTANPMPAMPAPTRRSFTSSLRAMTRAIVMAASATALWMPARPMR